MILQARKAGIEVPAFLVPGFPGQPLYALLGNQVPSKGEVTRSGTAQPLD
jgi:hypothetical protein